MSGRTWRVDHGKPVPTLRAEFSEVGQHVDVLFLGDLHWDHSGCDRAGLRSVFDQAVERDAAIVLLGDSLCLMQGRDDRRSSKGALRSEHKTDDYLSAVVEDFASWLTPYADRLWFVLTGNHETAVQKRAEVDVTDLWVRRLNAAGASIAYAGYSTYAQALVTSYGYRRQSISFFTHHGHGGGGEVTKGSIQAQRRAVVYPDADFVVSGHIHSVYNVDHEQWRLGQSGRPYEAVQTHLSVGTWKDEWKGGRAGWHVEKGRGPRQRAGWWVRLSAAGGRGVVTTYEKAVAGAGR